MELEKILDKLDTTERAFLESLIYLDPLTQIANRRMFDQTIKKEYSQAQHNHQPLSLLMIDIDNFKQYNDTKGHQEGDTLLHKVAQTINANTKQYDTTCRIGGEEYAVIMPQATIEEAYHAAERIRQAVQKETGATISIGVANTKHTNDHTQLILNADQMMYLSKEHGRNRTTCHNPLTLFYDENDQDQ